MSEKKTLFTKNQRTFPHFIMRYFSVSLIICMLLCLSWSVKIGVCAALVESSAAMPQELEVLAKSAILIDAATGRILYAKDAESRRYPASTTKIMTVITALEYGNLSDTVVASEQAANTEGSTIWLAPGEKMKLSELLYGAILASGNDATVAIAEHISGSVPAFAQLMTAKAQEIGATNTHFANANGLPDENHYTTAHDLAKIAAYGYQNPLFTAIVSTRNTILPWQGKDAPRELFTENKLLWIYDGANGVKTGYTDAAGRCLVAGAKRNGLQLIAVVLDSGTMWTDSMKLLDYGFSRIYPVQLVRQGQVYKTITVKSGKTEQVEAVSADELTVPRILSDQATYEVVVEAENQVEAPIAAGQKLGRLKIMYQDQEVSSVDLLATQDVAYQSVFNKIWKQVWSLVSFVFPAVA